MTSVTALVGRFLILIGIYCLLRIGFYIHNIHLYHELPPQDVLFSFLIGMRFDLAAICLINSPYILVQLMPWRSEVWKPRIMRILFVCCNGIFIGLNIFDIEYFQFTSKRLTASSFHIAQDMQAQIWQVAAYYWHFSLLIVLMFIVLWALDRQLDQRRTEILSWPQRFFWGLIALGFTILGARGGSQIKPLIPAHAYLSNLPQLANLSLNSSFTILKTYNQSGIQAKSYFPNWRSVEGALSAVPTLAKPHEATLPEQTNVLIIILESFNLEYMGMPHQRRGYTPFLDELARQGTFFPYHIANGRRSIDAMPSIFAGIPSWMQRPFITSSYQTNSLTPLPKLFKQKGYETAFFHGGENGTMFFDVMAERFGFDRYWGAQDYPSDQDHDGHWGIYDGPFLQFTGKTLSQMAQPFFASVFTLSSHQPYSIPPALQNKFAKGTLEIHESIGYADYSLREFFRYAKSQPWYGNTLFVITSDHTSKSEHAEYQTEVGSLRVPLIFFHPMIDLNMKTDKLAQQADILPTLVDLFAWSPREPLPHFGNSLLLDDNRHVVIYSGGRYKILNHQGLLSFEQDQLINLEVLPWLPIQSGRTEMWDQILRAKVQYYHNGLIEDRLIW
ncbi:LTA synthase family protein [Pseudobacteriovorax antillogorgiicola]|uniref:Uncharacterized sulfatase n=1 Tax=Pseudobacteriovorax antillogorgiicola TaxID=1513793 RepID=A0A1Y6CP56_9BACT|nr:alkaline phosphatase family protein [Pseudobacteriovorax antillogorgiicola]TCS43491.1 putative sulfatase [Pseudobacteriovorax antillogorgiicola]SMF81205.1 uncharacterized sulfatase [Pseudobacteriovorax antillogorgiicola]